MPQRGENNPGKGDGDQRGPGLGCRCQAGVGAVGAVLAGVRPGWEMPLLSPPPYPATPWACKHPSPDPSHVLRRAQGAKCAAGPVCVAQRRSLLPRSGLGAGWAEAACLWTLRVLKSRARCAPPTLLNLLSVQGLPRWSSQDSGSPCLSPGIHLPELPSIPCPPLLCLVHPALAPVPQKPVFSLLESDLLLWPLLGYKVDIVLACPLLFFLLSVLGWS